MISDNGATWYSYYPWPTCLERENCMQNFSNPIFSLKFIHDLSV